MRELLGDLALFGNAFIASGYFILVAVAAIRVYMSDYVPDTGKEEGKQVSLILLVMFLMSFVDRSVNALIGGVNAYLITNENGPVWQAFVVILSRFALGASVWKLVLWVFNFWNPNKRRG